MIENYNINPYYDDYDDNKNFHRLLFKPSYAVQARELTQTQTILQKQIERFGNHIFKNGSVVTGGQFFFQDAIYLKLNSEYSSTPVNVFNFEEEIEFIINEDGEKSIRGKTITSLDGTKRGEVIKVFDADLGTGDPKTLLIKQIFGDPFVPGETIKTSEESPYFATIATSGVGESKVFSVNEGVFYYEGFFIKTKPQTVAVSKYSTANVSARIGFDVVESIVTSSNDTSLLDPALGSSNYQAPGADRAKIQLILTLRTLESTDDEKFIELVRVEDSELTREYRYPLYSVLEDTLARRTYDESGNYTVRPFKITLETNGANTAQTNIILSPGKAYVYGYEFETNAPTVLTVDKPRETANVDLKRITADYGNYIYTKQHFGSFPINSLNSVEIHCVPKESIEDETVDKMANTLIGTARVKGIDFASAANTSDPQTYEYQTFLFDININRSVTGNVVTATGNQVTIGSTGDYSNVENAYAGARFRITNGFGAAEPPKIITAYNATTKVLTLDETFIFTPTTSSQFSIDFDIKDAECLIVRSNPSTNTIVASANIDDRSKDFSKTYADVFVSDGRLEPTIIRLGEEYIKENSLDKISFTYRRLYPFQSFSANDSPSLSIGTGEEIRPANTEELESENFYISVTNKGASAYEVGDIIPVDKFVFDSNDRKITVDDGQNMVANIIATITVNDATEKSKTYIQANPEVQSVGGSNVFSNSAVIVYGTHGQTIIAQNFVTKLPNIPQSLFVSDVVEIVSIKDFRGQAATEANLPSAVDVTSKYSFDNGQRDSFYDHSSISLRPAVTPPIGPLVVFYNRFTSSGSGFFTVDSYSSVDYGQISVYTSPTNGIQYNLRDCIDFRPVRADATTGSGSTVSFDVEPTTFGPKIIKNGTDLILSYQYYLPRIDKVVLDKNQTFEIIRGTPEIVPAVPKDKDTAMSLYILKNGAYVANTSQISVESINNKRYTMRDIGKLERRIENLEYYTSLSLLEQETLNKQDLTILDTQNLPRFKNGILVDAFTGSSVADVTNDDYIASIDPNRKELRPSFNIESYTLTFDAANSTNYLQSGPLITPQASSVMFIDQPKASRFINVNPFNVINFLGKITLDPSSDIWIDTERRPDVLVNIGGDRDAWEFLIGRSPVTTEWGSWQTFWTGTDTTVRQEGVNEVTRVTTTDRQSRTGITSQVVPQSITQSIGDRVVDISIIPFMRSTNILFVGTDFKPSTTLYPFFDGVSIEQNVGNRVNKFYLTDNNIGLKRTISDPEFVTIRDGSTIVGEGIVAHISNNIVYVTNVVPTAPFTNASSGSFTITGQTTNLTYDVTGYEHNGANASSATINTITLRQDANGATNISSYVGKPIFIAQGTGVGQVRIINDYNPVTRVATVNTNWTTTPDTTSFYSIGRMKTDDSGSVVGIFTVPEGQFKIGEKLFRLVDNASGDIGSSSTNGDASFFAQGLLQRVEETIISTTVPQIQRTAVSDERVVSTTTTSSRRTIWSDPLAQTFLVSPVQYPQGIFMSKVRVCFKSKDDTIPVTLQVRPVVNGYPSSSVVYPFATVSLTPDKVNVTDEPNLEDSTKYTEFIFDAPLYMQPGEHSFVILANTNKYEMFIAEIGKQDLVTNRQISEQPYGGSLFLSQNGSTWTADQNSDMMFRLFRYQFSQNPVTVQFLTNYPEISATPYDLTHLITADVTIADTSLQYQFNSETLTSGYVGYKPITPLSDYSMNDGAGTRILNPITGQETFVLNALMQTNNRDITPFIDVSRAGFLTVHNLINNLPITNTQIVLVDGGSGYANSDDVTVTIEGGNGFGALAKANVVGGVIDEIYIEDEGSGYSATPTITITPGSGGGSGAQAIIVGETSRKGGPALTRYITRKVTLNDRFDSSDIRVYMTAYKPKESQIYVYVKLLSASDPEIFENREWQLLTQIGNANFSSANSTDYRELTFAPGVNGIAESSISYESNGSVYPNFKTFAVKIVMAGTNTADVPKIRDLRVIALPGRD